MNTSLLDRITIEPGKCGGRPCVRGSRIRVTDIPDVNVTVQLRRVTEHSDHRT